MERLGLWVTLKSKAGREAGLMAKAPELLAEARPIQKIDLLAMKAAK